MKWINRCCPLLPVLLLFSCVSPRYVYTPTAVNNPCFIQKHESKLGAYVSGGFADSDSNYVRGIDLMGAYAIGSHVAVTANYHHRSESNFYDEFYVSPFDTSLVRYSRSSWELGAGYFQPVNDGKTIVFNVYGGFGRGSNKIAEEGRTGNRPYSRYHNAGHFKFYLQPGLNLRSTAVRFGVSYGFHFVWYNGVATSYSEAELKAFNLNGLQNDPQLFKELSFTLQAAVPGLSGTYVEGQCSFSTNEAYRRSRSFNASAGLVIDVFKLLKGR